MPIALFAAGLSFSIPQRAAFLHQAKQTEVHVCGSNANDAIRTRFPGIRIQVVIKMAVDALSG